MSEWKALWLSWIPTHTGPPSWCFLFFFLLLRHGPVMWLFWKGEIMGKEEQGRRILSFRYILSSHSPAAMFVFTTPGPVTQVSVSYKRLPPSLIIQNQSRGAGHPKELAERPPQSQVPCSNFEYPGSSNNTGGTAFSLLTSQPCLGKRHTKGCRV